MNNPDDERPKGAQLPEELDLRAYIATAALQCVYHPGGRYGPEGMKQVAEYAVAVADALIAELRKDKG